MARPRPARSVPTFRPSPSSRGHRARYSQLPAVLTRRSRTQRSKRDEFPLQTGEEPPAHVSAITERIVPRATPRNCPRAAEPSQWGPSFQKRTNSTQPVYQPGRSSQGPVQTNALWNFDKGISSIIPDIRRGIYGETFRRCYQYYPDTPLHAHCRFRVNLPLLPPYYHGSMLSGLYGVNSSQIVSCWAGNFY